MNVLRNIRALDPVQGVVGDCIAWEGESLVEAPPACVTEEPLDGGGRLVTPGLIDLHTHGIERHLYESDPESLASGLACLPRYGVTAVCPTLYRVMDRSSLDRLAALANALDQVDTVRVPGLHLEGPFLALGGIGAQTMAGDVRLLDDLLAATGNRVAAMSISPDTPGVLPVVERLAGQGIAVFITHTRAGVEETVRAIDAGARHATHFYDVFHLPGAADAGVRPVGAVETILADPRCTVDFIADGIHVDPMAIRAALAAKGPEGVALITDANIGAGLPAGTYETPWGFPVHVVPGQGARNADPRHPRYHGLAGSSLTMPEAVGNVRAWLDLPGAQPWAMASWHPARVLGLDSLGRLLPGAAADFVLWDERAHPPRAVTTWVRGRKVWEDASREERST